MSQIRWSTAVLILLFSVTLAVAHTWNPPPPPTFVPVGEKQVPTTIAEYTASAETPASVDDKVRTVLSSASIIARSYQPLSTNPTHPTMPVEFILIGGTDRSALHDPRSCLIGSGWTIKSDYTDPLSVSGATLPAHFCQITNPTLPGKPAFDILYLYVVDGKIIESVTQIRAQMLVSALLGRKNTPVYFLRFLRAVDGSDATSSTQSHRELQQFASAMWSELELTKK